MEKNKDRKFLGYVIWIVFFLIFASLIFKVTKDIKSRNQQQINKPKQELKVDTIKPEQIKPDTITAMNNPWPVRVQSVEKSDEKNTPKWQVVAENGVMYYTNKKPKIGDIAFYLNDNDEITDRDGNRMERPGRQ